MAYSIISYPALASAYTKPNQPRPITMLVIYATEGSKASDLRTLSGRDPSHVVSAHYYVTKLGEIYQLVADANIAWHAGVSYWQGESNCNLFSLGIELENRDDAVDPYPLPQLDALLWLCQRKAAQYGIAADRLVRHRDIAPGRKGDPRAFPWATFKASVFGGAPVEAPAPAPQPSPDVRLRDALLDWSYRRAGHVYHPDWALHQLAVRQRLGPPVAPMFQFRSERQSWVGESYGADVIASPVGDWQRVER